MAQFVEGSEPWAKFTAASWTVSVHGGGEVPRGAILSVVGFDEGGRWSVQIHCAPDRLAMRWSDAGAVGADDADPGAPTQRLIDAAIRDCIETIDAAQKGAA